jgi:hypothetical protein
MEVIMPVAVRLCDFASSAFDRRIVEPLQACLDFALQTDVRLLR